jgi:hypothetical protein
MLRDPVGGAATNLVPAERPQDIYGKVAEQVTKRLQETVYVDHTGDYTAMGPERDMIPYAHKWLDFGIDRKITKRPVMVLPYGGTFTSCRGYVRPPSRSAAAPTSGALRRPPRLPTTSPRSCGSPSVTWWSRLGRL